MKASARTGPDNRFVLYRALQASMEGLDRQEVAPYRTAGTLAVLLGLGEAARRLSGPESSKRVGNLVAVNRGP